MGKQVQFLNGIWDHDKLRERSGLIFSFLKASFSDTSRHYLVARLDIWICVLPASTFGCCIRPCCEVAEMSTLNQYCRHNRVGTGPCFGTHSLFPLSAFHQRAGIVRLYNWRQKYSASSHFNTKIDEADWNSGWSWGSRCLKNQPNWANWNSAKCNTMMQGARCMMQALLQKKVTENNLCPHTQYIFRIKTPSLLYKHPPC